MPLCRIVCEPGSVTNATYKCEAVRDERKRPGVIPTSLRKVVMNWLWLEKPHCIEISTSATSGLFRSS